MKQLSCLGLGLILSMFAGLVTAAATESAESDRNDHGAVDAGSVNAVPDLRDEKLTFTWKDLVAVPIPLSNPTLGTGLIGAAAYFWPQTADQAENQPASLTGIAGMYTSNKSTAGGIIQQNYWGGDKWRSTLFAGVVDLNLTLDDPVTGDDEAVDWLLDGAIVQGSIARRISKFSWYLGVQLRYIDVEQAFDIPVGGGDDVAYEFDVSTITDAVAAGLTLSYDSRDIPTNAYTGGLLELKGLYNQQDNQTTTTDYSSYTARWRSYHQLSDPFVLAYDINSCFRSGDVPLWDACRLNLRGFNATKYMAKTTVSAQAEARWEFFPKWGVGLVGFAGAGYVERTSSLAFDEEWVPSYGVGLRWMVMRAKRINFRIDYARSSNDSDAWYIAVTEAF